MDPPHDDASSPARFSMAAGEHHRDAPARPVKVMTVWQLPFRATGHCQITAAGSPPTTRSARPRRATPAYAARPSTSCSSRQASTAVRGQPQLPDDLHDQLCQSVRLLWRCRARRRASASSIRQYGHHALGLSSTSSSLCSPPSPADQPRAARRASRSPSCRRSRCCRAAPARACRRRLCSPSRRSRICLAPPSSRWTPHRTSVRPASPSRRSPSTPQRRPSPQRMLRGSTPRRAPPSPSDRPPSPPIIAATTLSLGRARRCSTSAATLPGRRASSAPISSSTAAASTARHRVPRARPCAFYWDHGRDGDGDQLDCDPAALPRLLGHERIGPGECRRLRLDGR